MFSNLRIGTPLYVLHRNDPKLEVGEVIFVSQPTPQLGTTYNAGYPMPTPKMLVDVKIKTANGDVELQKLPAELSIADFSNGMVISESKDAILNEVDVIRKNRVHIIESVEQHKCIVEKCDVLLAELNPQIRQEAERTKEFDSLKQEVGGLKGDLAELKGMLSKLLN
jgi:hypothetical protein